MSSCVGRWKIEHVARYYIGTTKSAPTPGVAGKTRDEASKRMLENDH